MRRRRRCRSLPARRRPTISSILLAPPCRHVVGAAILVLEDAIDAGVDLSAYFAHWSRLQRRAMAAAFTVADDRWEAARMQAQAAAGSGAPAKAAAPTPQALPAADSTSAPQPAPEPPTDADGGAGVAQPVAPSAATEKAPPPRLWESSGFVTQDDPQQAYRLGYSTAPRYYEARGRGEFPPAKSAPDRLRPAGWRAICLRPTPADAGIAGEIQQDMAQRLAAVGGRRCRPHSWTRLPFLRSRRRRRRGSRMPTRCHVGGRRWRRRRRSTPATGRSSTTGALFARRPGVGTSSRWRNPAPGSWEAVPEDLAPLAVANIDHLVDLRRLRRGAQPRCSCRRAPTRRTSS